MSGIVTAAAINTPLVGTAAYDKNDEAQGANEAESFTNDIIPLATITPSVTGGSSGSSQFSTNVGGSAALALQKDVLGAGSGSSLTFTGTAVGGDGGEASPMYGIHGGAGGDASTDVSAITTSAAAPSSLALAADGGAPGNGGNGGSATASLSGSTIDVSGEAADPALTIGVLATGSGGSYGLIEESGSYEGGAGGSAAAALSGNTIAGASIALTLSATGGAGGVAYNPYQFSTFTSPNGIATVAMSDNQVSVTGATGTLSLSLAYSGATPEGEPLSFGGNSLQGGGASTLALSLPADSYAIDTAAGTIAIDGSGANTLAGFSRFNLQGIASGDNSFIVGSATQEIDLGGGYNTVTITPDSRDLTIIGATQSNLVLDFESFGPALASLTQFLLDVSMPAANTELITLPNGVTVTLEGTPIVLNRLNVALPDNPALPPPPADNLPASAINTPVVGAAGGVRGGQPEGQAVSSIFDNELLTQSDLTPTATGGAGAAYTNESYIGDYTINEFGAGGAASLVLNNDIIGPDDGAATVLNALATGGAGPGGLEQTLLNGGAGGNASVALNDITEADENVLALSVTATGGAGGGGNAFGTSGDGGTGGSATSSLTNSAFTVSGSGQLSVSLEAAGGAGGMGGSNVNFPSYGDGGMGGNAATSLAGDELAAAIVSLGLVASVGLAGPPGSSTAEPVFGYNPPPGSGTPGVVGTASLTVTDNQIAVDAPAGTLSLQLGAPGTSAGLASALTFTGNSLTGEGDSTLDLSLLSGSYTIDAAAGTIAIAGSALNTLTGFDIFDMVGVASGSNSFTAGSGAETLEAGGGTTAVQLGSGVTTVVVTAQTGNLDLLGATDMNVVLVFQGLGPAFDSFQQLAANTSVTDGTEQIALPDGSVISLANSSIPLSAADVRFAGGPVTLPPITLGTGISTLRLVLTSLGQPAEFTVSIDGTQVGGVQTTSADGSSGQDQELDLLGDFATGTHSVTLTLLNSSGSTLAVESAAYDGTPLTDAALTIASASAATIGFTADGSLSPVTVGFGPDTLALTMSQRGEPAGAQFTVSVDGNQIGGVETVAADLAAGGFQVFDVLGNFAQGPHTLAITYLDADNSLLAVDSASLNGAPVANSATVLSNSGTAGIAFESVGSLTPMVLGSGPDTLALTIAERGQPLGAQFTISVNGQQIGGVQTTLADVSAGLSQEFDVLGSFGRGSTVSISYLNASNSLLEVESAAVNGTAIANTALVLSSSSSAGFAFNVPVSAPVTIGSGADTLALNLAQQDAPSGALFTVDVDGAQIGGVQSVSASNLFGQIQTVDVLGNFSAGPNTVSINYLNPNNSLLLVDGASINGSSVDGSSLTLSNHGAESFTFSGPQVAPGAVAVGAGPDQLALVMAQRGEPAGALFTVDVDGTQVGGIQTVTADSTAGQTQSFDVLGLFQPGSHSVSIDYLNAHNSLLLLDNAAINGNTINGAPQVLSNVGVQSFTFVSPPAPGPVPVTTAPDTLALNISEDFVAANAQFTLAVDGVQQGGVQTTAAIHGAGQSQAFDVTGNFSGTHTIAVNFLNAAVSGGTAGTLYLGGASIDGSAIANSALALSKDGTETFTFTH